MLLTSCSLSHHVDVTRGLFLECWVASYKQILHGVPLPFRLSRYSRRFPQGFSFEGRHSDARDKSSRIYELVIHRQVLGLLVAASQRLFICHYVYWCSIGIVQRDLQVVMLRNAREYEVISIGRPEYLRVFTAYRRRSTYLCASPQHWCMWGRQFRA